jgi:hypothetical protein
MALIDAIASLSTPGPYTVTRTAAGSYTNGRYTEGAESTFTIIASIQPVTGRDLADLPEGQNGDEVRQVFTITELLTRVPGQEPDIITLDGEDFYVYRVKRWQGLGEVYWQAWVSRIVVP